jgi:hypothetical protein
VCPRPGPTRVGGGPPPRRVTVIKVSILKWWITGWMEHRRTPRHSWLGEERVPSVGHFVPANHQRFSLDVNGMAGERYESKLANGPFRFTSNSGNFTIQVGLGHSRSFPFRRKGRGARAPRPGLETSAVLRGDVPASDES